MQYFKKLWKEIKSPIDSCNASLRNPTRSFSNGPSFIQAFQIDLFPFRPPGIVITQEIKNLMNTYKEEGEGGVDIDIMDNYNFTNVVENLSAGITGSDDVEKYKKLCVNLVRQLKELGNRLVDILLIFETEPR